VISITLLFRHCSLSARVEPIAGKHRMPSMESKIFRSFDRTETNTPCTHKGHRAWKQQ
jgi:hypothetical protein